MFGESEQITTLITLVSVIFGLVSTVLAIVERRNRVTVERVLRDEMATIINRVGANVPSRTKLQSLVRSGDQQAIDEWIWMKFQGVCDIYIMVIGYYLSSVKKFTYDDLKALAENGTISSTWEERMWRSIISLRDENRGADIPGRFIA